MTPSVVTREVEIRHWHAFCGAGGGALGFNRGRADLKGVRARFRCLGGVDVDARAIRDFTRLVGVPGTVLDLFTREQYIAFHGHEPPPEWREATADDIRRSAGGEVPHIGFFSAPCQGASGLQSETRAATPKYQALNSLVGRALDLMFQAWGDDLPELIIFENVPRIMTRARGLLDDVTHQLEMAGYLVRETTHDCGELGGLAQRRKRFLMVARLAAKVPSFLYEPEKRRVRGVGEVLSKLPLPDDEAAGPMHRLPKIKWLTQVRLALIPAGGDWRDLQKLDVVDGYLRDIGIVPRVRDFGGGPLGVLAWDEPAKTIAGQSRPTNGRFAVSDPRCPPGWGEYGQYGVLGWGEAAHTITVKSQHGGGRNSVADPRIASYGQHGGKLRVEAWDAPAHTVTTSNRVGSGAMSVADPRVCDDPEKRRYNNVYRVVRWDSPAAAVTAGAGPSSGGQAVADPRLGMNPDRAAYRTAGHYGVVAWETPAGAVTASGQHDNGRNNVADPRLPAADECPYAVIISLDNTWHRPFTSLECAGLQGLPVLPEDRDDPDAPFVLDGATDGRWREAVGNMVPPPAAEAIACEMGRTLLMAWTNTTFRLSATPIWVRRLAIALTVAP
jgi:site-specific DNA-cytosine methylase